MSHSQPVLLNEIPGTSDDQRLALFLHQHATGGSRILLCQQSWADGIGWFTQSSVEIMPEQVSNLRQAFGQQAPARGAQTLCAPRSHSLRVVG